MISLSIAAIALIGTVATFSSEGPDSTIRTVIAVFILASTVPAALFVVSDSNFALPPWISDSGRWASAFVLYADVGISAVLATFVAPEAALFGANMFAIVSIYAAMWSHWTVSTAHLVFTGAVTAVLAVMTWQEGEHDLAGTVARTLVVWLVVGGTFGLIANFSHDVQRSLQKQTDQALTDPLTGLLNRRGFQKSAASVLAAPEAAVLVIDVDHFKSVNDTYGHDTGDDVLRLLARRLSAVVGSDAAVGRTGGEEFAIAVPAPPEGLTTLATSLLHAAHHRDDPVPITVSIGVAARVANARTDPTDQHDATVRRALAVADSAMYSAKAMGRNTIVQLDASR